MSGNISDSPDRKVDRCFRGPPTARALSAVRCRCALAPLRRPDRGILRVEPPDRASGPNHSSFSFANESIDCHTGSVRTAGQRTRKVSAHQKPKNHSQTCSILPQTNNDVEPDRDDARQREGGGGDLASSHSCPNGRPERPRISPDGLPADGCSDHLPLLRAV